ncbi:MAG: DUF4340 domain-containing protein [Chthoniobacterales bacterium]|nr:DUF4340 domain-containing protein [Chthoniobacterales bacterium]
MKTKTTLVLLALVLAVGTYIKFYESKRPNTSEGKRQAQNVVNFDRTKIDGLTIQNGDDRIDLRRVDGKWRIEAPFKDRADGAIVEALLADLDEWQRVDTIPAKEIEANKDQLTEFGLSKAKLRLKFLGKEAPPEILFGKDAALEGKMYVRLENSKEAIIAGQSVRNDVAKNAEEFRDKKLTDIATGQITRAVLKVPAGEMELLKEGDAWNIVKPLRARGDGQKISDFLAQVTTARIQQFVAEDRGDLHPYGLAEPRGSITLFSSDDKQGQTLQIGGVPEKQKDDVYVRFLPRSSVYTLPKKIEQLLNTKPVDLRDRHLARIDANNLDRITIEAPGRTKTILARKNDAWTIVNRKNQPANATEANRLLETLKNEQVTNFVDDVASDLTKYGLDKPQLQIAFSSFASENTAETPAGDRPFATIAFGKTDGDVVYARLGDEPFVVAARRALLDGVFADPLQWQELAVFKLKPEQVHRLSVVTDQERTLARGANNTWMWLKGNEPINQVNVQSLLNTLTSLRAVRWIGGTTPAQGFEKPQIAITFTTSPDDKALHKLLVGGPAGDGMWFARTDEREGVFVISNPDFNALRLPLVAAPAAAPAPGASSSATPMGTPSDHH